jgi:hypothetical protein
MNCAPGRRDLFWEADRSDVPWFIQPSTPTPEEPAVPGATTGSAEEDARMLAILQEQEHQWDLAQEDLST